MKGLNGKGSMTESLFENWYLSDCYNEENHCPSTEQGSAKCQYYINMYKLAINYCEKETDKSSMKWKVKHRIESYLIKHSKQITSTGIPMVDFKLLYPLYPLKTIGRLQLNLAKSMQSFSLSSFRVSMKILF